MSANSLNEIISLNRNFKTAVNLYLSLNKTDKVLNYIPTKSSVDVIGDYISSVLNNKEQATILIGPYGKGKSHLLLVLLAILSLERNDENEKLIKKLTDKIKKIDEKGLDVVSNINQLWNEKGRYLPVVINDSKGDLNQAFLIGLNEALKRDGITDLTADTYYSIASERLADWKNNFPETYELFDHECRCNNSTVDEVETGLNNFQNEALGLFTNLFPKVTAGGKFNPLSQSDVLPLYKSVSEKLVENYGYSGIYIVFDEFSKFIEGQDGYSTGNNMKLLQSICELATDSSSAQVFITLVAHKSIKEYGKYISQDIINSFTGIEGRIVEKYFITSSKNNYELIKNAIVKTEDELLKTPDCARLISSDAADKFYSLPVFKSTFDRKDFIKTVLVGCYPMNPIVAYILLQISEKSAQNERTLFTFISNDEPHSMARYVEKHSRDMNWFVGADLIYDYFSGLFKKDTLNEFTHSIWLSAEYAISKCTTIEECKFIKALAIICIVNRDDELPADEKYISLSIGVDNCDDIIRSLESKDLIYIKASTGSYVFKTRAGSVLKSELKKVRSLHENSVNYSSVLEAVTGKYYVIPRKYNAMNKMTRYFKHEYMSVESFLDISSSDVLFSEENFVDGIVITLFGFASIKQTEVKAHFKELNNGKIILVVPHKFIKSCKRMQDFEALKTIKNNQTFINNNEILNREIPLLEEDIITEIEMELDSIYLDDSCKVLYWDNGKIKSTNAGNEELAVNICCSQIYSKTPIINNELINKRIITTAQTKKARVTIIQAILDHVDNVDFYTGTSQEATIYRAVLCNTGLVSNEANENINTIIDEINNYIDSCCDTRKSLATLVDRLTSEPYGMRLGVLPIYLAYVFSTRKEDFVIYYSDTEVPVSADIIVKMCDNPVEYELFVSKEDLLKEKYIAELNKLFLVNEGRNLSDNRIKNIIICMQRWFRALPQVTRNIARLDDYCEDDLLSNNMRTIRRILQKVEINPYEVLFVSLPNDFETTNFEDTFTSIKNAKNAYDKYFDWIQNVAINLIYSAFNERKNKDLYHSLKEWYDCQSNISKQGLHGGRVSNLMSCIEQLNIYDDIGIAEKIVKAVSDVYVENWNDSSMDSFSEELLLLKSTIENIKTDSIEQKMKLSFIGRNGNTIEKYYSRVDEGTGAILRNILEDELEEFDDLSTNDRVAILLEMIEKIIG